MRRRGVALVVVMSVLALVLMIGVAATTLSSSQLTISDSMVHSQQAVYAAEAGLADGLVALTEDADFDGYPDPVKLQGNDTSYLVQVFDNRGGTLGSGLPNGIVVPNGLVYVLATGFANNGAERRMGAMIRLSASEALQGAVADQFTLSAGSVIDSYDSATGPYDPTDPTNKTGGDIAVNSDTGFANLSLNSHIYGTVYLHPALTPSAITTDATSDYLDDDRLEAALPEDLVTFPVIPGPKPNVTLLAGATQVLAPGGYKNVTVGIGSTLVLQKGDYVFQNLDMLLNAQIFIADGPVNIYISQSFTSVAAGIVNTTGVPSLLNIHYRSAGNVTIAGGSSAYFTMDGRLATITVAGGDAYGQILAKKVNLAAARFHFDRALGGAGSVSGSTVEVLGRQRF
ncbi:MAG: pilus assembly PilX N-terminal domain-containing protein [Candidatus Eremiobacteraeota bacterium]|nr:pilus assembly PilX N-terminal domain-containing protein [Candidatus Eremiobacteraeota bacterium]